MVLDASNEFTTLNVACACNQISGSVEVPSSALPLKLWLCQCNTCRYVSGNLSITSFALPAASKDLRIKGTPRENKTSNALSRYFCGNCGSPIFEKAWSKGVTYICSGTLTEANGVIQFGPQIFVDDTKDGGIVAWLPGVPASAEWPGSRVIDYEAISSKPAPKAVGVDEKLLCKCQCGSVEFKLKAASAYKGDKFDDILQDDRTKYLASTCVCNDCRQVTGHEFQNWAFVPIENVEKVDGSPMDFAVGTLKKYKHSQDADRYFCEECGATVFWHGTGSQDKIDVAVGLMRAESGARAEEWLTWRTNRLSGMPFGRSKFLNEALTEGLKQWGEKRHETSKK